MPVDPEAAGPTGRGRRSPRDRLQAQLVRAQLEAAELVRQHAALLAGSGFSFADDEHDPEGATLAYERQQLAALVRQAGNRVDELAAALVRFDAGSYGRCLRCGRPIAPARLAARPAATTCRDCAS